jgi:hypothetical protein
LRSLGPVDVTATTPEVSVGTVMQLLSITRGRAASAG